MANIVSKEKCIVIDGASIPLNSMTCSEITNGAMLTIIGGTGNIRIMVNETTLDGNPVSNRDELISYLQENCFNLGGNGTSEGVQSISGSSVDNTDPKNPIVNSTSVSWSEINDKPLIVAEGNTEEAARAAIGSGTSNLEIGTVAGTAKSGDYTPALSDITGLSEQLSNKENKSEKGQALGYTPLDASGLVPLEHLNVSGLQFKGAWNPNTNTPTIVDGTGSVGDFYKASEAGSFNSGNGNFTYAVGDWVIFAGGIWQRLGSTELVASVNGKLGMVVINKSDIGLGNADNTSDANKPISTATASALSGKANTNHTHVISDVTGIQAALDAKANFPDTNQHVPIRTAAGAQGSFQFATPATGNTFVFRDGNGRFAASAPVSANDVVNKTYADKAGLISSTTSSAVTIREFTDRFEYTTKNVISSLSIPAVGTAYPTASYLPVGVTITECDELSCTQYSASTGRYIYVGVRDGSDRRIVVEFGNLTNAAITWSGTIFVKLVKYK